MERPFLHRKCSSVSPTSWSWPSFLQRPSFLSHYTCSSRLGLELIGKRFPASQPLSSLGSRGGLRLVYSDAWPQFTQCTSYGRIYSVRFVLVLQLLVHRYCRIVLTKPPPPHSSELRWLEVGSSQTLRVARQVQLIQPTAAPQITRRPRGGVLADPASSHAS
jgi:hypothetical protein